MDTLNSPLRIESKKAVGASGSTTIIDRFTSYTFDRNILTPASSFRFVAPAVDKTKRMAMRSGDLLKILVKNAQGTLLPVGQGIIDETDCHILPTSVDYLVSGRDSLGQLVDNAAVDATNTIITVKNATLPTIYQTIASNTRLASSKPIFQQTPNGTFLFQTQAGETKINAIQRYLELANCLIWTQPNGQVVVGRPNFTGPLRGRLIIGYTDPSKNNVLEGTVRRSPNLAIRQIVTQLQTLDLVAAGVFTKYNNDRDLRPLIPALVGRSVYRLFSYGQAADAANQISFVGNTGAPEQIGGELSLREIARENMKVIDVECIVEGHVNSLGQAYNIDQVYDVFIEDEDVQEPMYVYGCTYELTENQGMITRLKLCRLHAIVSQGDALPRST